MNLSQIFFPFLLTLSITSGTINSAIDKIVIWGLTKSNHTHYWIHYAYHRAFKEMGFETYWLEDKHHSTFDFQNSLFFVAGIQDKHVPLREDCRYILHNCDMKKYQQLFDKNNCIRLQVYTHDCLERNVTKVEDCIYIDYDRKSIYMPWATDLLPREIDTIKDNMRKIIAKKRIARFVGTCNYRSNSPFNNRKPLFDFKRGCSECDIDFEIITGVDMHKNIALTQEALVAPAIQGEWQCEKGYIPCRIFKNISYGQMGVTNSKTVYDLFKGNIVYNADAAQLAHDAIEKASTITLDEIFELMDFVRDNHTYINRIKLLLSLLGHYKPLY